MNAKITPREMLQERGLMGPDVVAVRIGDRIVDLHTPVDESVELKPIHATEPAGLEVIRHSTAHVMADAVQRLFPGTKVTFGPAVEDGFYYDFQKAGGGTFTDADLSRIEATMRSIIAQDAPFRREVVSRDAAVQLFQTLEENFKVEHIERIPADEDISLYRHGDWVDLCSGPHVPSTGFLRAVKLTSVAGAYWRGDERNPMLQRIYGTAFSSQEALDLHLKNLEDARARDHRKLGKELELFMFSELAPAMPFFLPKGAAVYNNLVTYVRSLYEAHGYEEVITPQAFDPKLFLTSGHLPMYAENMYRLWTEDEKLEASGAAGRVPAPGSGEAAGFRDAAYAMKPMNCPSHCVIFGSRRRSYRDLPWRVADFGRLHRYERGGVVHGLSRVRTFCQDDAHVFCSEADGPKEIARFIELIGATYRAFRFDRVDIKLATRPDVRLGSDELWDRGEGALEAGLKQAGMPFEITPKEGAFYGPKIEFHVQDALKRSWQLGTIQYDGNLPERFDLGYIGEDGKEHRPVMFHRAMLGSLERFFAVYLEHVGGNFPVWLAPKHAIVLTVTNKVDDYARQVTDKLRARGLRVDADLSADKLGAKIRNARLLRYPYICVIGGKEAEVGALGVRSRDRGELGAMPTGDFIEMVRKEMAPPVDGDN